MTRYDARRLAAVLAVLVTAACSSGSGGADPSLHSGEHTSHHSVGSRGPAAAWPTYHGNNQRSGVTSARALRAPLRRAWSRQLDGAVYAQPIVVGGRLIVATENNTVYALRQKGGGVVWRRHLAAPVPQSALPCGNIDPIGITGTPAYDRAHGTIFVVTETTGSRHILRALNWRNGHERWHRSLDVLANRDRQAEQQRAALLVTHGRVYAAFGGRAGDCGNYVGYVVGVPTDGTGRTLHYAVPTAREAGIWAPPGPVQDKTGSVIYVSSGNGAATGGAYDGSDSVIELGPKLHRRAFFAPSTWASDNAQDLDLGSSALATPALGYQVIAGKRGTVYFLSGLHGIGSQRHSLSGCTAFGGAAFTAQDVILPCTDGIRMVSAVGPDPSWEWQLSGVAGSPVIAGKRVYALDIDSGELVLAAARTGRPIARIGVGSVSRFATPVPVGPRVYVGTLNGVVAVRGS